jgi:hypothetical protein
VTTPQDLDAALDRLDEALRSAGLAGLEPPSDLAAVAEVADAVTPYSLPAQLRRLWERVDPESIGPITFPKIGGPTAVLEHLRVLEEIGAPLPLALPPIFVPIDYASQCYGVVELESEWSEGGTILEWDLDGIALAFRSVRDWIEVVAELVAEGSFERGDGYVALDHRAEQEKRRARLDASTPDPVYGDLRAIPSELQLWPPHWLAACGVDLRDREPLGATHSIAALVSAAGTAPVKGRIHAEVIRLVGSGAGALVLVDDRSGQLDIWCPAGTSPWGPVHRQRFEFELAIEDPVGAPPDLDSPQEEIARNALAGDLESAQHAALAFHEELERHRPAAVASDVRPLD